MSNVTEPGVGQVVHLLQHWGDGAPPVSLRMKPSPSTQATVWIAGGLTVITVLGGFQISTLWIFPTPGLWFSLLFTAFVGGLVLAGWAAFAASRHDARQRDLASMQWAAAHRSARCAAGIVVKRAIITSESGEVSQFSLAVKTDRVTIHGTWRSRTSPTTLLQSQVPGVGAPARVWRLDNSTDSAPLVIEVLDPTVVASGGGASVPTHVD